MLPKENKGNYVDIIVGGISVLVLGGALQLVM